MVKLLKYCRLSMCTTQISKRQPSNNLLTWSKTIAFKRKRISKVVISLFSDDENLDQDDTETNCDNENCAVDNEVDSVNLIKECASNIFLKAVTVTETWYYRPPTSGCE